MRPDVSVIVVNFRTPQLTVRALDAARAAAGPLSLEEIVVDNGGSDAEALREARPGARVVALPENRGFAAGNNAGIAASSGRYLLLVNSDAFAAGDAVSRLVAFLDAHPGAGVVAPMLLNEDGTLQIGAYRRFPSLLTLFVDYCLPLGHALHGTSLHPHSLGRAAFADGPRRIAHAMGAALLVRREAADAAGPLDEGFFLYLEETEWQRRLTDAGWTVHLEPRARVTHLGGGSQAGSSLANPHYLASVERYFGRRRAPMQVMAVAAYLSLAFLSVLARVRPEDPRVAKMGQTYRDVLAARR